MINKLLRAATGAAVGVTMSAACSGGGGVDDRAIGCTNIGCMSTFILSTVVDVTAADIPQMTIEVCRNTECLSARFSETILPEFAKAGAGIAFSDHSTAQANDGARFTAGVTNATSSEFLVDVQYWASGTLADGDVYTVTVKRASIVVASIEKSVTYTVTHPNGVACGPECRNASF